MSWKVLFLFGRQSRSAMKLALSCNIPCWLSVHMQRSRKREVIWGSACDHSTSDQFTTAAWIVLRAGFFNRAFIACSIVHSLLKVVRPWVYKQLSWLNLSYSRAVAERLDCRGSCTCIMLKHNLTTLSSNRHSASSWATALHFHFKILQLLWYVCRAGLQNG